MRVGPGDDAAVTEPAGATATTVDALVEGIHFTLPEFPAAAIGRKAMTAGLSDLAAMGAEPGEAYVVLGLSESIDEAFCLELFEGLSGLAKDCGVELLGGDVSRSPVLVVSVTAIGYEGAGSLVTRAGAKPGNAVAVTGELGGAAAGLRLLDGEEADSADAEALRARQLSPEPRLAAGQALARAGATAMIDISDGLGADAVHLAEASVARLEIELEKVPVQTGVAEVAGSADAGLELAVSGGEDYELLTCLPPGRLADAASALEPLQLTEIGAVAEGSGVSLRTADGSELEPSGFKHF